MRELLYGCNAIALKVGRISAATNGEKERLREGAGIGSPSPPLPAASFSPLVGRKCSTPAYSVRTKRPKIHNRVLWWRSWSWLAYMLSANRIFFRTVQAACVNCKRYSPIFATPPLPLAPFYFFFPLSWSKRSKLCAGKMTEMPRNMSKALVETTHRARRRFVAQTFGGTKL